MLWPLNVTVENIMGSSARNQALKKVPLRTYRVAFSLPVKIPPATLNMLQMSWTHCLSTCSMVSGNGMLRVSGRKQVTMPEMIGAPP